MDTSEFWPLIDNPRDRQFPFLCVPHELSAKNIGGGECTWVGRTEPMDPLSSAMAMLALQRSYVPWGGSVGGTAAASSWLGTVSVASQSTGQVHIRWRYILTDVVQRLGGTEPEYACENTMEGVYLIRVSFSLPGSRPETSRKYITVLGAERPSFCEAENEASVAALKELEHVSTGFRIMDVSGLRCKELEKVWHKTLVKAKIVCQGVKSVLLDWERVLKKVEIYSSPLCNMEKDDTTGEMCPQLASHLAMLIKDNYVKLEELTAETEQAKVFIDNVYLRGDHLFCESCPYKANRHKESLALEIQISMKIVLQEMMISLGWKWPIYEVDCLREGVYVCETFLYPKQGGTGNKDGMLIVIGSEAPTKEMAVESSCQVAISILQSEKSIWLVDLNLKHRLYREVCDADCNEALQLPCLIGSKVLVQWKSLADEFLACQEYCHQMMVECSEEQLRWWWRLRRNADAVGRLRTVFLNDMEVAEQRLKNYGWSSQ